MALSLQRSLAIIIAIKIVILGVTMGLYTYDAPPLEGELGTFAEQQQDRDKNLFDFFLNPSPDTSNTYLQNPTADEKLGFEFTFWDVIRIGIIGWIPQDHARDQIESYLFYAISFILTFMTFIGGFEAYQIIRGKTT